MASEGRMEMATTEQVQEDTEKLTEKLELEPEQGAMATHTRDEGQGGLSLPMELVLKIVGMVKSVDDMGLICCPPTDFASLRLVSRAILVETHLRNLPSSCTFGSAVATHLLSIWNEDQAAARRLINKAFALPLAGRIRIDHDKTKKAPAEALNYVLARCISTLWLVLRHPTAAWLSSLDATRLWMLDLRDLYKTRGSSGFALPNLAECRQLRRLRLAPQGLLELKPDFRWPPALEHLVIDGQLEDVADLKLEQCSNLVSLLVPDTALASLGCLGRPSILERLSLQEGSGWLSQVVQGNFRHLAVLKGLKELSLASHGIKDFTEVPVVQLKSLERLKFSATDENLKSLRGLDLSVMPQLHTLVLNNTILRESWHSILGELRALLEASDTVRSLSIRSSRLEDDHLEDFSLCRCNSLTLLDIGSNSEISLAGLQHLDLPRQRQFTLIVDDCKISCEEAATVSSEALRVCGTAQDARPLQRIFHMTADFDFWYPGW